MEIYEYTRIPPMYIFSVRNLLISKPRSNIGMNIVHHGDGGNVFAFIITFVVSLDIG